MHGVVQGYTTWHGKPVAVVLQRSTYNHDVDSVVGFIGWGEPALTHDVHSWMRQAAKIIYTFNWFYVDNRDIGYYVSGRDPIRALVRRPERAAVGHGRCRVAGFLGPRKHVHEVNPSKGYLISWNNKPAPRFAAADDQYGYGQVFRSIMLVNQLQAAVRDPPRPDDPGRGRRRDGDRGVAGSRRRHGRCRCCSRFLGSHHEPAGVRAMISQLRRLAGCRWAPAEGAAGRHPVPHAAAIAIMDQLMPNLIRALFDRILAAGGLGSAGSTGGATTAAYKALPMQFVNTPNSGGAHLGSAYDGGYEGYLMSALSNCAATTRATGSGRAAQRTCAAAGCAPAARPINAALLKTYKQLVKANGNARVSSWTQSSASKAAGQRMPRLRRDPVPGAGRRRPAGDRLAEPADLPAGRPVLPAPPAVTAAVMRPAAGGP